MKKHEVLNLFKDRKNFVEIRETYLYYLSEGMGAEEIFTSLVAQYPEEKPKQVSLNTETPITVVHPINGTIDPNAIEQLKTACTLPVAIRGALLPDGHYGYSLPIGGVVALKNAISPAFVGFDIGCRMRLSKLQVSEEDMTKHRSSFFKILQKVTSFGKGADFKLGEREHPIMEDPRWDEINILKQLKPLAQKQLGSSGGGNHFANLMQSMDEVGYYALLTHSGSRGTGHRIARFYDTIAKELQRDVKGIPKGYNWLDMDSQSGKEYWLAMNLLLDYAYANHELIHEHFSKESGVPTVLVVENAHNTATIENVLDKDGISREAVVHRKGATPASIGKYGVIPGSCSTPSYFICGKGNSATLNSASHGAGRARSSSESARLVDWNGFLKEMKELNILHAGIDRKETSFSYKQIEDVISAQTSDILYVVTTLIPIAVVMGYGVGSDDGD